MSADRNKRPKKPLWEMNTDELRIATREFEDESAIDGFRPLTRQERQEWERIAGKHDGNGDSINSVRVSALLPLSLIRKLEASAKQLGVSRARMIQFALSRFVDMQQPPSKPRRKSKSR